MSIHEDVHLLANWPHGYTVTIGGKFFGDFQTLDAAYEALPNVTIERTVITPKKNPEWTNNPETE